MANSSTPINPFLPIFGPDSQVNGGNSFIGSINDETSFNKFINALPVTVTGAANTRLVWGIKYIRYEIYKTDANRVEDNPGFRDYILRSPLTYFQLYSDIFSKTLPTNDIFHNKALEQSTLFKELNRKTQNFLFQNIKNYKNSLNIGINISKERDLIAGLLDSDLDKKTMEVEKIKKNLEVDNSTLTRQAKINRDEFFRQEFKKHILRFTLICICLFIFISYSGDIGVGESTRLFMFSVLIFLYVVKIIMYYYEYLKRHKSDFNYKGFTTYPGKGYPVIKECTANSESSSAKWFEFNFLNFNKKLTCDA